MYCGDKFGDFCQIAGDFLVLTPGHTESLANLGYSRLNFLAALLKSEMYNDYINLPKNSKS